MPKAEPKVCDASRIIVLTAEHYGLRPIHLTKGVRAIYRMKTPTMICALLLREEANLSFPEIARAMGRQSHAGVIYLVQRAREAVKANTRLKAVYDSIAAEARA
jgi:chromosomal replication initiation ATPase DnaA